MDTEQTPPEGEQEDTAPQPGTDEGTDEGDTPADGGSQGGDQSES